MQPQQPQRKNTTIYWVLIAAPPIGLVITPILQIIVRFALSDNGGVVVTIVNLVSFLVGMVAIVLLLLLPLWVILLVQANNFNKKREQSQEQSTPPPPEPSAFINSKGTPPTQGPGDGGEQS